MPTAKRLDCRDLPVNTGLAAAEVDPECRRAIRTSPWIPLPDPAGLA